MSCLQLGMTLPSRSCARHQRPWAFWVKIVFISIMVEDGDVELRGQATLRMCGQVWVGMWACKLGDHGGECMILFQCWVSGHQMDGCHHGKICWSTMLATSD